ncbi:MAG: hypothetical protein QW543_02980 [Sulfolobales archaeon]
MRVHEVFRVAGRTLVTTSSHIVLLLVSASILLLSYSTRNSEAVNLVPVLASIAGLTIVEYGKHTYNQLFYSILISGATPKHLNLLKVAISFIIALPLSLSTISSNRVAIVLFTLVLSGTSSLALLTYYARKVKESCSATIV